MSSTREYLNFILEQLTDLPGVTYRPMMGEYILYLNGKIVGGIYDDRLLVKSIKSAVDYIGTPVYEIPYESAKKMILVENVDSADYLVGLFRAMYNDLPEKRKK